MNENKLENKKVQVGELAEIFKSSQSAVVVEYRGLSVAKTMQLRRLLRDENVEFKVYKNTIAQRAAEAAGIEGLGEYLKGPNALVFSDDAVAPSRILSKFAKKNDLLKLKAGIVEGTLVDAEGLKEIAKLPNREGMISMILGCLQSPIRSFALSVKAVSEQKAE